MLDKPLRKRSGDAAIAAVALDPAADAPLHVQLASQLRQLILSRRLQAGARLPSSRQFAQELSVSRSTVVTALDQLASEGYSEGRHGSGVYVTADLAGTRARDRRLSRNCAQRAEPRTPHAGPAFPSGRTRSLPLPT